MTISSRTRSIDPGDSTSPPVSEFLERLSFDRGAPAALKRAARRGDATAFVKEWFAALASRCQGQKLQWPQSAWNWMDVDPRLARAWRSAASPPPSLPRPTSPGLVMTSTFGAVLPTEESRLGLLLPAGVVAPT